MIGETSLERARRPVPMGAAERIQEMIRSGECGSGTRLPAQRELAERLRVSRASLREALSVLETLGVIRIEPGRGVFVAEIEPRATSERAAWRFHDRYALREVYEVRLGLEAQAVGLAVDRAEESDLAGLDRLVSEMEQAVRESDLIRVARVDADFHDLIFAISGNRMLQAIYERVRAVLVESQRVPMADRSRLWQTVREHKALLEAMQARDLEHALRAMETHIRGAARRANIAI